MARPGPGNGCFFKIEGSKPKDFPNFLTSSLNNSFNGSIKF